MNAKKLPVGNLAPKKASKPREASPLDTAARDDSAARADCETIVRSSADLGALLRDRRKALALRQLDLAGLGGTGNRFVVDVENGKPTVQLQKVIDLMALLGLEFVVRPRGRPDR